MIFINTGFYGEKIRKTRNPHGASIAAQAGIYILTGSNRSLILENRASETHGRINMFTDNGKFIFRKRNFQS